MTRPEDAAPARTGDGDVMRAMVIRRHGNPDVLEPADVPIPEVGPGEALIRVRAVSVNVFLDVANRAGRVPFARYDFPHILGSEHAGEVVAYGPDTAATFPIGARVVVHNAISCGACRPCLDGRAESCVNLELVGVMRPGAYAEFTVVPTANLRLVPPHTTFVEAAAMSVNGPLATVQLTDADVRPGDTVLVQGAASSTGTMSAVVARALGCRVFGTTRSVAKLAELERLDIFDAVLDSNDPGTLDELRARSGGGVDIVVDNVGSPELWKLTMAALAPLGRVVSSGAMFGGKVELDLNALYRASQRVIGVRSANEPARQLFWQLVRDNTLRPVIDSTFALGAAADAHRRLEAMGNVGRVVVEVSGD